MSYLYLDSARDLRGISGACFHKPASRLVCVVREEPVTERRGSILQLVFAAGRTWRTERGCVAPPAQLSRRPASTPILTPL